MNSRGLPAIRIDASLAWRGDRAASCIHGVFADIHRCWQSGLAVRQGSCSTLAAVSTQPGSISQNADIRYLGRLLGDVIRAYGGQSLFERIESIRSASVDRYRGVLRAPSHRRIRPSA